MRAYVIGNATIDESFTVTSLPEPGESIKSTLINRCLGGKGANQAVLLSRCGVDTTLITATAADQRGNDIRQLLSLESLTAHYIKTDVTASDQSILLTRTDGENAVISTTACAEQIDIVAVKPQLMTAQATDCLILQGNLDYQTTHDLLVHAKATGMLTLFNPSPVQKEFTNLWTLVDVLFLNSTESHALTGFTSQAAIHTLLQQGVGQVVLTEGKAGAWLATTDDITFTSAKAAAVVDTTGAGDTFMSVAIGSAQLRTTVIDPLAMQHAHQAAAMTVSRYGTISAFPTSAELTAMLATAANFNG